MEDNAAPPPHKAVLLRFSAQHRHELELLYREYPRPTSCLLQQLLKERPLLSQLDISLVKAWFHSRRLKERRDEKLSPLVHKNAELKAEHESLLLMNRQLRKQAFELNLENRHLKEQLELLQLQKKQGASSSMVSSDHQVRHAKDSRGPHDDDEDDDTDDEDGDEDDDDYDDNHDADDDGDNSHKSDGCGLEKSLSKLKLNTCMASSQSAARLDDG